MTADQFHYDLCRLVLGGWMVTFTEFEGSTKPSRCLLSKFPYSEWGAGLNLPDALTDAVERMPKYLELVTA